MHAVPPRPALDDAPTLTGHLWLQERVDGTPLRVQLGSDGRLRFGDDRGEFDAADAPPELRFGVHEVERRLDRAALRDAVGDVESVTLVGTAPHARGVDYDWDRLPGFLGTDVHDAHSGDWLPPDRAEQVFERLGLASVNTVAKEVRAADFQPERYAFPDSAWRDGPVAGVVVRTKTGGRARLENPDVLESGPAGMSDVHDPSVGDLASRFATRERIEHAHAALESEYGSPPGFDALQERVMDSIHRERAPLFEDVGIDHVALRRGVAARINVFLDSR